MRHSFSKVFLIAAFLLLTPHAEAVYETVVIEKPFHVRSLAGTVVDSSGAVIEGVEISDCDRGFERVLGSTTSDRNGVFSLPRDGRSTHYLSFRAAGFNPLHITVELRQFSHGRLKVRLPIGG